jgi:hypothetical protein
MPAATINDLTVNYKLDGAGDETIVLINAGRAAPASRLG